MRCLIAGGSGLVGSELIDLMLADNRVTALYAVGRKLIDLRHPKLKQMEVDFSNLASVQLPRSETAFCCLGTTIKKAGSQEQFRSVDHDYVVSFAKMAKNNGCNTFVVISALGADKDSKIFYNRVKGEMEQSLKEIGFPTLIIVRPSLLLGDRKEKRPAEELAIKLSPLFSWLMVGPLRSQRPVPVRQVARAMLKTALANTQGVTIVDNKEIFSA